MEALKILRSRSQVRVKRPNIARSHDLTRSKGARTRPSQQEAKAIADFWTNSFEFARNLKYQLFLAAQMQDEDWKYEKKFGNKNILNFANFAET